jgi:hypothetical protein
MKIVSGARFQQQLDGERTPFGVKGFAREIGLAETSDQL